MDTGAALGGTGLFISLVGIIYSAINHKHIKSNCCGRKIEFSIDIDSTTDEKETKKDSEKDCEKGFDKASDKASDKPLDKEHEKTKDIHTKDSDKLFKSTKFKVQPFDI